MPSNRLEITTAGYDTKEILYFSPGMYACGKIEDGVELEHGNDGGWVISFFDLESMYKAAKIARNINT